MMVVTDTRRVSSGPGRSTSRESRGRSSDMRGAALGRMSGTRVPADADGGAWIPPAGGEPLCPGSPAFEYDVAAPAEGGEGRGHEARPGRKEADHREDDEAEADAHDQLLELAPAPECRAPTGPRKGQGGAGRGLGAPSVRVRAVLPRSRTDGEIRAMDARHWRTSARGGPGVSSCWRSLPRWTYQRRPTLTPGRRPSRRWRSMVAGCRPR